MSDDLLTRILAALQANRSGFGDEPLANMLGEECALPCLTVEPQPLTPAERHAIEMDERARWPEYLAAAICLGSVVAAFYGAFS